MLFDTWQFAVFFIAVFVLYHTLQPRAQNVLLVLASYFFYGCWDWRFLSLIAVSTGVDYVVGLRMQDADHRRRRRLLIVSVCTNLGILGFFKYFNFFTESAQALLSAAGVHAEPWTLSVILPVGISFYTFQTMAYTIDVYRGRIEPERSLLNFALYVCYFPQLVAGPIERAQNLLPQIRGRRRVTVDHLSSGAVLVLIGLVRKVAIADPLARHVDSAFANPTETPSVTLLCAVVMFGMQIYCDFAGYSDIARGVSRMLGIELCENFSHPYFSTNITVFWRRWHISLSSWLRDYLYIPLGGNRGPRWMTYRNSMLTMLLGGLWHGAAWRFVVWGGLHGVALAVHKLLLGGRRPPDRPQLRGPAEYLSAVLGWAGTMLVVFVAWVFFRAPTFPAALEVLGGICVLRGPLVVPSKVIVLTVFSALLLLLDVPQYIGRSHTAILRVPWTVRGLAYAGLALAIALLRVGKAVPFIYFQF